MMRESINKAVMVVIAAITIFVLGLLLLGRFTQIRIHDMQQDKLLLERDLGADLIEKEFLVVETFLLDIDRYVTVHNDDDSDLLDYLISIDQDHEFVYSVYLGYPKGVKGTQIPLFSRIISIADSFEAMTANRPYRTKMSVEYAVSEMKKGSGTQFDPALVKLFIEEVLNKKM
jgi:hypothetical protein